MSDSMHTTLRVAVAALIAIATGVAGWLWMSPQWALGDLRDAGRRGNTEQIIAYIDQQSLRKALTGRIVNDFRRTYNGTADISVAIDQQADHIARETTPEKLAGIVEGRGAVGKNDMGSGVNAEGISIIRTGVTSFVAGRKNTRGEPRGVVFQLDGLGWRVTDVQQIRR